MSSLRRGVQRADRERIRTGRRVRGNQGHPSLSLRAIGNGGEVSNRALRDVEKEVMARSLRNGQKLVGKVC